MVIPCLRTALHTLSSYTAKAGAQLTRTSSNSSRTQRATGRPNLIYTRENIITSYQQVKSDHQRAYKIEINTKLVWRNAQNKFKLSTAINTQWWTDKEHVKNVNPKSPI